MHDGSSTSLSNVETDCLRAVETVFICEIWFQNVRSLNLRILVWAILVSYIVEVNFFKVIIYKHIPDNNT